MEHQKRQELLKAVEPRDRWVQNCLKSCAVKYKDSKKAKDLVSAETKEKMLSKPLKEFNMDEFEKYYIFGLQPVLDGSKYQYCISSCERPQQLTKRASKLGADMMDDYYDGCLLKTKKFNHIKHYYEVSVLEEMKCHVMRKQISLKFLDSMKEQFSKHQDEIIKIGNEDYK